MSRTLRAVHTVTDIEEPVRIDSYLCDVVRIMTRSQLSRREARFFVGSQEVKASRKVRSGDQVTLLYQELPELELHPEQMDLDIIYEDERILAVNKPAGIVVHPGAGNFEGTLIHGVLNHCRELKQRFPEAQHRPGIVHRLDKDTSGVIVFAKDPEAHEHLARQFHDRTTSKTYSAVLRGVLQKKRGTIHDRIVRDPRNRKRFISVDAGSARGREAISSYLVLRQMECAALVRLTPVTGRTHQLRVHMKTLGHPIINDPVYGSAGEDLLLLHASSIRFAHPDGSALCLRAPLPERFSRYIRSFGAAPPLTVRD